MSEQRQPFALSEWQQSVVAAEGLQEWSFVFSADAYCQTENRTIELPLDCPPSLFLHEIAHALYQEPEGDAKNHYHGGRWASTFGELVDRHMATRSA